MKFCSKVICYKLYILNITGNNFSKWAIIVNWISYCIFQAASGIAKVIKLHCPGHLHKNCVPIHQVDADILHWINDSFDLLVALDEKSLECIKFHANPFDSCWNISLKKQKMSTSWWHLRKRGMIKVIRLHPLGLDQIGGPTNQQTNIA